jgi:hypothetical protein
VAALHNPKEREVFFSFFCVSIIEPVHPAYNPSFSVFLAGTVFFSQNKSVFFQPAERGHNSTR